MEEISIQPKHYLTCLWPGMAELWWRGRISALPAAIAFAAIVNALLVAKFIYSDWLSGGLVMLACWVAAAAWLVLTIRSIRELPLLLTPRQASDQPDPFPEAQGAFLRADYVEAEKLLNETLSIEPRDPPALLLLSAIYRHTGRLHASQLLLAEVRKLEVADHWELEFAGEQSRLQRDIQARQDGHDDDEDEDEADGESSSDSSGDADGQSEGSSGSARDGDASRGDGPLSDATIDDTAEDDQPSQAKEPERANTQQAAA